MEHCEHPHLWKQRYDLIFFWSYFGFADDPSEQGESLGLKASTWPAFIAYFALVNPFMEEYFWRGYFGNPAKGLYIYDFVYAGWFWRQVSREDHGLLAPVLGHMMADFTIAIAVYRSL